ncbi:MAG TPA: hypothetical protein VEC11_13785 [Allosphingosinicella sp.]|nr:hypothetical protein [Allosphingosinicella sp.]
MRISIMAALVLAAVSAPATALAAGSYYVRNDTRQLATCGARRPRSQVTDQVSLRPGAEWSQTTERDETRTLICYIGVRRQTFRMVSGQRYALLEAENGALWLRALGTN